MLPGDFTQDLEAVARGLKSLAQIRDPKRREAIRIALGLIASGDDSPDPDARARMRRRVLTRLPAPHTRRFSERLFGALTVLAAPAPYILRAMAVTLAAVGIAATASVASADSLPDEPLYVVKLASEELRLALAATPEDRATVELSIAEHRLAEAERLASSGRDDDAIVATGEYGSHLANAAAELASVEVIQPRTTVLVAQLEQRLAAQQARVATTASRLADDPRRSSAATVLAAVAATARPVTGPTDTPAARIAANAAAVAERVSEVADARVAAAAPAIPLPQAAGQRAANVPTTPVESPRAGEVARPAGAAPRTESPRVAETPQAVETLRVSQATPRVAETPRAIDARATAAPRVSEAARATDAVRPAETVRPTEAARPTEPVRTAQPAGAAARPLATPGPSAKAAAEAAKKAYEAARLAAERAKQAGQRTPPPGRR